MLDLIYHRGLKRPYKLHTEVSGNGRDTIVMLHGINSSKNNWVNVTPYLPQNYKTVLIDLTGFGDSPKPSWPSYDLSFHAKQVEYTLKKLGIKDSITLVGHSMGGLISIEIAKRNPSKVNNLILANTPLYEPKEVKAELARYKKSKIQATNLLFAIYEKFMLEKEFTLNGAKQIIKLAPKDSAFSLTQDTWVAFEKSLKNAIMKQNSISTVKTLKQNVRFLNGLSDMLVVNKHHVKLAKAYANINLEFMAAGHMINKLAGKQVAKAIKTSLNH